MNASRYSPQSDVPRLMAVIKKQSAASLLEGAEQFRRLANDFERMALAKSPRLAVKMRRNLSLN